MTLGTNHLIHINHLQLVFDRFDRFQHGLSNIHLQRKDRQNVRIAQEVCFIQVILCLQNIIEGDDNHAPDESVTGTMCYLKVAWMYTEMFFFTGCHIIQKNYVCDFLGIWRNFVHRIKGLNMKTHFITRECYRGALISCHFVVFLICFTRDNYSDAECRLDLSGSDPCEIFFSINGQWIGNHHTY